jgi:hypothetical protein
LVRRTSRITTSVGASNLGAAVIIANKFFWCANYWKVNSVLEKASSDSLADVGVGDVLAVPCQKELHLVNRRRGNMDGITGRDRGQNRLPHEVFG